MREAHGCTCLQTMHQADDYARVGDGKPFHMEEPIQLNLVYFNELKIL